MNNDDNKDYYEEDDHGEFPASQYPWREITTFICFLIAFIWLLWKGVSWLIQIL